MTNERFIGLMSGTSMDGVDGVLADLSGPLPHTLAKAHIPFDAALREALFALQATGVDEIEREAQAAHGLAGCYAQCCAALLAEAGLGPKDIQAIGVHGQTIRHRPELGFTRQTNNPSELAELTGIDVVADFRSRDVAAGGQGAPLAPIFHAAVFGKPGHTRVLCNIGGISNVTVIHGDARVGGFDCGPGNVLLDDWAQRHLGTPYDDGGMFAAQGKIHRQLLASLLKEPYFSKPPPKSTGRDLFNPAWLESHLQAFRELDPADVQATLVALTAGVIAADIARHANDCEAVYVCGGGARNPVLMAALCDALMAAGIPANHAETTEALGIAPQDVEALAFAWLAQRFVKRLPGNIPSATGAVGERILGALYPG